MEEQRDDKLWRLAKKRAGFQRSLASYFMINAFLWLVWWFTSGRTGHNTGMPWPVWVMLGWGISLLFQYMAAYGAGKQDLVEKEYDKLKNRQ
ncbi:MAG: 2TM domain-containing protein [Pedobacter sp.]|nr:MAG: 2TM domain-containing protein [Pedobacter sp.]